MGVEHITRVAPAPGGNATRVISGGLGASRLGFRGTEDIGGGVKAFFVLESGFSMDTGALQQGGRMFGRMAYVGVQNNLGSLSLGRHRNAIFDVAVPFDPMTYNLYSIFSMDPVVAGRVDNSIRFTTQLGPVNVSAQHSFGYDALIANGSEVAGNPKVGRESGVSASYTSGPLAAMIVLDRRHGTT
jgi:predicted porin